MGDTSWLDRVIVEAGSPWARSAYERILRAGALLAVGIHSLSLIPFLLLGFTGLALANLGFLAAHALLLWLLRLNWFKTVEVCAQVLVVASSSLNCWWLGWDSGFHYYIFQLLPLVLLGFDRPLGFKVGFAAVVLAFMFALAWTTSGHPAPAGLADWVSTSFLIVNLSIVTTTMAIMAATNAKSLAAIAVALRETNQKLETLAYFDPLTGLPNRRALWDRLKAEVARSQRHPPPPGFVVVLADVDDFKDFNDRWGHDLGDAVLTHVAQILKQNLREQDVAGRWGGEEFLMVLPETEVGAGQQTLERLRIALARDALRRDGRIHAVTLTFGYSPWIHGEPPDLTISRADAALLVGKRSGKDRIVGSS